MLPKFSATTLVLVLLGGWIPIHHCFLAYIVHDVSRLWQSETATVPPLPLPALEQDTSAMAKLIETGVKLSTVAHNRLAVAKPNRFRMILVEELTRLEALIKRAKSLSKMNENPFMKRLIGHAKQELESMINYFHVVIQLYDQNEDSSMPALTGLVEQLADHAHGDIGFLSANGLRDDANRISDHSGRLQVYLRDLKRKMDHLNQEDFSRRIRMILAAMAQLEQATLEAEQHWNHVVNFAEINVAVSLGKNNDTMASGKPKNITRQVH